MGGFYQARAFVLRMGDPLTGGFLEKNFATFLWHGIITETAVVLCLGDGKTDGRWRDEYGLIMEA